MASRITDACINCNACADVCPTNSIFKGKAKYFVDYDTCAECLLCKKVCPVKAIENTALQEWETKKLK